MLILNNGISIWGSQMTRIIPLKSKGLISALIFYPLAFSPWLLELVLSVCGALSAISAAILFAGSGNIPSPSV